MSWRGSRRRWSASSAAATAIAAEIPALRATVRLRLHGAARRAPCRTTTPPIPACCGCSTARRCGSARPAPPSKSCADCHGDAGASMKGVAARYPAFEPALGRPIDLGAAHQHLPHRPAAGDAARRSRARSCSRSPPMSRGSRAACRSRSRDDERTKPFIEAGRDLFNRRQGQLNLSCAQCHDDNWGQKLAGAPMPQGHPDRLSALSPRMAERSARCSGGCAIASSACAPSPMRTARRNTSISSST